MSWVAVAIGGSAVVGAYMQGQAAQGAAGAQADAARQSNEVQLAMYNQTRADQEDWRRAGSGALSGIGNWTPRVGADGKPILDSSGNPIKDFSMDESFNKNFSMEDFQEDPGYQFRMKEGMNAIQGSASARGMLNSGATLKALTKYGQDVASSEYENAYNRFNADADRRFNRLSSIAGIGQTANSQVANAGQNYADQVGQNIVGAGNANAAAQVGTANAINQGIQNVGNTWMSYQAMNQHKKPLGA